MNVEAPYFRLPPLAVAATGETQEPPRREGPRVERVLDAGQLEALIRDWRVKACIAIDTEFVRERTYHARPGLIQIATDEAIHLVDPLAVADLRMLGPLLGAPQPLKVFHAAGEDLQLLYHLTGVAVQGVYDCQVAAAFCGRGAGLGYLKLVQALFDVALEKGETRSDWLARPLTEAQLHYAALDTAYLLPVYRQLREEVEQAGHAERCALENQRLSDPQQLRTEPDCAYARIRGHERLCAQAQLRLRHLAAWRERFALANDVPRTHVIRDAGLLTLARRVDIGTADLKADELMHPRAVRRYGDALVAEHALAVTAARGAEGPPLTPRLDRQLAGAVMPRLKRVVTGAAKRWQLPPELLASRRELEALVAAYARADRSAAATVLPAPLDGWRRELIGAGLLEALDAAGAC